MSTAVAALLQWDDRPVDPTVMEAANACVRFRCPDGDWSWVDGMPRVHPDLEKRSKRVQSQPHGSGLPLRCIYVLEHGLSLGIEPVAANDALLDIICHWYGARFGTDFLTTNKRVSHFQSCARLAAEVPVYRLIRPDNLELLPELAQLVAAHVPVVLPRQ